MKKEESNKQLFKLELIIGYTSSIVFILLIFISTYIIDDLLWQIILIILSILIFTIGILFALIIETYVGYYKCRKCHHKYVPSFKSVFFSTHFGRTRYMRCPKCHKKSWNKKVLN